MTKTEKIRLTKILLRDTARFQHRAIVAASRVGFRTMHKVLNAWRVSQHIAKDAILNDIPKLITTEYLKSKDELRDAMLLAHLSGIRRSHLMATLSFSATGKDIKKLSNRLQISQAEIERQKEIYNELSQKILMDETKAIQTKIQKTLNEIEDKGLHVKAGRQALIETFDNAGITPDNTFQIETIYRTHTQMAYSAARWQTNTSEEIAEILWGYEYSTVGDMRVRPEHAALDGVKLPKDDRFWLTTFPPNGWNCRCQAIEMFEPAELTLPPGQFQVDNKIIIPGADKGFDFNPGITIRKAA